MRTRIFRAMTAIALILPLLDAPAAAQGSGSGDAAAKPSSFQGVFTFGGAANDDAGAPDRASEYDVLRQGALGRVGGQLWGDTGRLRLDARAQYGGSPRDQFYEGAFSYARWLNVHVKYVRFPHRLEHDPLAYVDAASGIGGTFVVSHTDNDPTARYDLTRGELDAGIEVAPPALRALRFFLGHRRETREGLRQSLTSSHCATCHVVSNSRGVNELTRELTAGARLALTRLGVEYTFSDRRFEERAQTLTNRYDAGVHPVTLADVFLNRLQYDGRAGTLPFDVTPASAKQSHLVRARVSLPGDASVTGSFTRSDVENTDTSIGYTYTGVAGRLVVPLGRDVTLRGSVRRYEIETDNVFVDVIEQVSPAGPAAGLTYGQAYPTFGDPDYVRRSSLARTPTEAALDLTWRPLKRTAIQAGYAWEDLQRTWFDVEKTTTNSVTLRARARPWKSFETRTRFQHDWIEDPFTYERAAMPAVLQPFQSPNNVPFTGLQYFQMYDARQADLTAFPTRRARLDQSIAWSPLERASFAAHYRLNSSENDALNFSTWSRTTHALGGEVWIAPAERWTAMAGYTLHRERLDTMFSILAFTG